MPSVDERVAKLEHSFATTRGGAIVLLAVIAGYMGYASIFQIPGAVRELVPASVEESVSGTLPEAVRTQVEATVPPAVKIQVAATVPGAVDNAVAAAANIAMPGLAVEIDRRREELAALVQQTEELRSSLSDLIVKHREEAEEIWARVQTKHVYDLGRIDCGKETAFDVPEPGTDNEDWLLLGVNPVVTSDIENVIGDNAIHAFDLDIRRRPGQSGWLVTFDVQINYDTSNRGETLWNCAPLDGRPVSRIQIIAVKTG